MRIYLWCLIGMISAFESVGQNRLTDEMKQTEAQLRASNKQINQFFRRFNGEEDINGKRFYDSDKNYRSAALRKKYVPVLFDTQSGNIDGRLAQNFIRQVTDKKNPQFLDFHSEQWSAEVSTIFSYRGKEIQGKLYMKLQAQGQGYEWVIEDVSFSYFEQLFNKDTTETKQFMHPMSHELEFMTLKKALKDNKHAEQFTARTFQPDFLSIFLYELNLGNLKFVSVKHVEFHFFMIDGYYFSLTNFNRPGNNSGWLIADLVPLANADQKQQMKDYIYGKNKK